MLHILPVDIKRARACVCLCVCVWVCVSVWLRIGFVWVSVGLYAWLSQLLCTIVIRCIISSMSTKVSLCQIQAMDSYEQCTRCRWCWLQVRKEAVADDDAAEDAAEELTKVPKVEVDADNRRVFMNHFHIFNINNWGQISYHTYVI